MAEIYLLSRKNTIELLSLDALLSEAFTRDSDVTEYAVEDGSNITDNIFNKPVQVVITGGISSFSGNQMAPDVAFQYINSLIDKRELITISTGLMIYYRMAITNFNMNRDKTNSGHSLKFSLSAKQVKIVKTEYINPVNIAPKIKNKVSPKVVIAPLKYSDVSIYSFKKTTADNTRVFVKR